MTQIGKPNALNGKLAFVGGVIAAMILFPAPSVIARQPGLADLLDGSPTSPKRIASGPAVEEESSNLTAGNGPNNIAADTRLPVPPAIAAKTARATVQDVFKAEIAQAKTPEQLGALSQTMAAEAERANNPDEQWALFQQSLELALASGSLEICEDVLGRLAAKFAVDLAAYRAEMLTQLAIRPRLESGDAIALACLENARFAATAGDLPLAKKLLGAGQGVARKTRNNPAIVQFKEAYAELRLIEKAADVLKSLESKYESNPGDRQVSSDLGRHYCFISGDWERGLPLLAKGADPELAQLASAELSGKGGPEAVVAVADAWLKWAQRQKGVALDAAAGRAVELYSDVRTQLEGLARTRVEKRIQEAAALATPSGQKFWLADLAHQNLTGLAFAFTKDGTYQGKPYTCAGLPCGKSLCAMPGGSNPAIVVYAVPPGAKRLSGNAGVFVPEPLRSMPNLKPAAPLNFEIRLDGRSVWKSRPLENCNELVMFDVIVAGGTQVELITTSSSGSSAFAAWIDPTFVK